MHVGWIDGRQTGTRHSWSSMITRCYNSRRASFKNYGGRGIKVCEQWLGVSGFENFLADMGERPRGLTLDRRDNDGDYTPDNCRWATRAHQNQNRRNVGLNWDLVDEIRGRSEHGETSRSISRRMSVPRRTVINVIKQNTWKAMP